MFIIFIISAGFLALAGINDPVQFGNETTTTCYIGGTEGIVNCTGEGIFEKNITALYYCNATNCYTLAEFLQSEGFGDIFVNETGDTMVGNLNMSRNNITEIGDMEITKSGAFIRLSAKNKDNDTEKDFWYGLGGINPYFQIQRRNNSLNDNDSYVGTPWLVDWDNSHHMFSTTENFENRDAIINIRSNGSEDFLKIYEGVTTKLLMDKDANFNIFENLRVGASSGESIVMDGDDAFILGKLEVGDGLTLNGTEVKDWSEVNQSDTNTNIIDEGLYNSTQLQNQSDGKLGIITSWFSDFFDTLFSGKTTDDLSEGTGNFYDNRSWNQSHANTLYLTGNPFDQSLNTTDSPTFENITANYYCNATDCYTVTEFLNQSEGGGNNFKNITVNDTIKSKGNDKIKFEDGDIIFNL